MNEETLLRMESQLDSLITRCEKLEAENLQLYKLQEALATEQSVLADKNKLARSRIEKLITQLKQLETQCGTDH